MGKLEKEYPRTPRMEALDSLINDFDESRQAADGLKDSPTSEQQAVSAWFGTEAQQGITIIDTFGNPIKQHGSSASNQDSLDYSQTGSIAKERASWKTVLAVIIGLTVVLIAIWGIGAWFYTGHLLPKTIVDGIDVSNMSPAEAKSVTEISDWSLTIIDDTTVSDNIADSATEDSDKRNHDEVVETARREFVLSSDEIGFAVKGENIDALMAAQNPLAWPLALLDDPSTVQHTSSYDVNKVKTAIDNLSLVSKDMRINPKDAHLEFDAQNMRFEIIPEQYGDLVDRQKLEELVTDSLDDMGLDSLTVRIDDSLTVKPSVLSTDAELIAQRDLGNKMLGTEITYDIDGIASAEKVDKNIIKDWVSIGENGAVSLDETKVRSWIAEMGAEYDTAGTMRVVQTANGKQVSLNGPYGWITDEEAEYTKLLDDIRNGRKEHREFSYRQTAAGPKGGNEIGDTYIDIDRTSQYLWYVRNGIIELAAPVITGRSGYETPTGITEVYGRDTDAELISPWEDPKTGEPTYRSHVEYWLTATPDNLVGIHSASWQSAWGTDYTITTSPSIGLPAGSATETGNPDYHWSGGSHGCINLRISDCKVLYDTVPIGTPIIIHD